MGWFVSFRWWHASLAEWLFRAKLLCSGRLVDVHLLRQKSPTNCPGIEPRSAWRKDIAVQAQCFATRVPQNAVNAFVRNCIGCPTTYQTRDFFNNSKTNEDIATKQTHTTDTFLFISHTNVLLFKSRCNIYIGFRIIKKMPGLVCSGPLCIFFFQYFILYCQCKCFSAA